MRSGQRGGNALRAATVKRDGNVAGSWAGQPSRHWQLHKGKKLRREKLKTAKLARAKYGQRDAHRLRP